MFSTALNLTHYPRLGVRPARPTVLSQVALPQGTIQTEALSVHKGI